MSILIPGMKMPKDGECVVITSHGTAYKYECGDVVMYGDAYNETADAIELQPHGRLGDLDKLDYAFTALRFNEDGSLNHWDDRKNWCLHGSEIEMLLANAPTIIPADPEKEDESWNG